MVMGPPSSKNEEVAYGFDELDELTHAYAVSIHRSQGSEYPCVVVPLTMSAWMMLQRNLLYTAVTQAKQPPWSWSAASAPWPRRSVAPVPAVATPPSPNGYDRDRWLPSQQQARQPQHVPIEPEQQCWDQPDRTR